MDKSNLIVKYLQTNVTEDDLSSLFGSYGLIQSLKIVRDKATGISMGFGFVNFETNDAANRAADALNGLELHGKRIKVSVARPAWKANIHSNLYIANLPTGYTEEDVLNLVGPELALTIEHVRMLRNSDLSHGSVGGEFRGVAVARFDTEESACMALEVLCAMTVDNPSSGTQVPIHAKPWRPEFRPERANASAPIVARPPRPPHRKLSLEADMMYQEMNSGWSGNPQIKSPPSFAATAPPPPSKAFVPPPPAPPTAAAPTGMYRPPHPSMSGTLISENEEMILASSFEQFGALPGVTVYGDRSWGFVRFPTMHAAMAAVTNLTGFNVNGKILEMEAAV